MALCHHLPLLLIIRVASNLKLNLKTIKTGITEGKDSQNRRNAVLPTSMVTATRRHPSLHRLLNLRVRHLTNSKLHPLLSHLPRPSRSHRDVDLPPNYRHLHLPQTPNAHRTLALLEARADRGPTRPSGPGRRCLLDACWTAGSGAKTETASRSGNSPCQLAWRTWIQHPGRVGHTRHRGGR